MGDRKGSIPIVQTYLQGRSIRVCILSIIKEIFSANASPLQKWDALDRKSVVYWLLADISIAAIQNILG
ncbi:hypothetical protein [Microcoleus sp. CAWBG58]|uniref:hypothetical protein n=1 Tax=Microcoleus sp. CAWBG58 TaxID=2841651 RepID=UPI0026013530|nr:hypothetical protein [Microcoleus sp. CAWBG58]